MKIIAFIGGGRAGIDFLQSLFDSHSQVSQLPGYFFFDEFWSKIKKKNIKPNDIAEEFISDYQHFFDSRLNLRERHHMLGENKNSFYTVDKKSFKDSFSNLFQNQEINKKNILYNLHLAYSQSSGEDLKEKKIIILNLHQIFRLKTLEGFDYEVVYTIRHPIASLSSETKHWLKYENGKHLSPWSLYFHIDRVFNGLKDVLDIKAKIHIVQLELLHRRNLEVMKDLTKRFKINFEDILTKSTYHGKLWWGDMVSGRDLNGVNPNFKNNIDYKLFYKKDIMCIEKYLKSFMIKYDYDFFEKKSNSELIKILPLKIEIKLLKKIILSFRIKESITFVYYFLKRVRLMKKDIYETLSLPNPAGKQ